MSVGDLKADKKLVLLTMYEHMMNSNGLEWLSSADVNAELKSPYPIVYLRKVLESLETEELIKSRQSSNAAHPVYTIAEDGILLVQQRLASEDALSGGTDIGSEIELLPASDRLVPINHNSDGYVEIADGLAELREELRGANDLDCPPEERERLLVSLDAAKRLWEASRLTIIQIKVGIIITVQDTIDLLSRAGRGVGKVVLLELIREFVRSAVGVDL